MDTPVLISTTVTLGNLSKYLGGQETAKYIGKKNLLGRSFLFI